MRQLPKVLGREPLVDAVFEVRFDDSAKLAEIFPGALYATLSPKPEITRLPASEMPAQVRAIEPNLTYAPLVRLDWTEYFISIGDRSLAISCKLPYPKWPYFKAAILDMVDRLGNLSLAMSVERYSIRYINLIEGESIADQIGNIEMSLRVGEIEVAEEHISVQIQRREAGTLHLISIVTGVSAKLNDGSELYGAIIDIDSIRDATFPDIGSFRDNLSEQLEVLRHENKVKFFSSLREDAINRMEPQYE